MLRTTVIVIGAFVLCFGPVVFALVLRALEIATSELVSWFVTFVMLNLLLNSLIYCGRQEKMIKFLLRFKTQVVVRIG